MHKRIEPGILYFGTPVVLISTMNEDGTFNLAPMSSAFWLGWRAILGLDASSKTTENLIRTKECVLNLPSMNEVAAVDKLAKLTGTQAVPPAKLRRGYRYENKKFETAGLTPLKSETVIPPRVKECPIQLEAVLAAQHPIMEDDPVANKFIVTFEMRIKRVHAIPEILMKDESHRIDPDLWKPLIMSFQKFYGLGSQLQNSKLAEIPESSYITPDLARSRETV